MCVFVPFVHPCMHHNYGVISGSHACKDCVWPVILDAELYITCLGAGEQVLVVIWFNITFPTFEALLRKNVIFSKKMLDSLTTYGCVLRCCQIVYTIFAPFFEHYNRILLCD